MAIGIARIMISLRTLCAERLLRPIRGKICRRGLIVSKLDHLMSTDGIRLDEIANTEVKASIKAAFYRKRDVDIHPFADRFVPPKWVSVLRVEPTWR